MAGKSSTALTFEALLANHQRTKKKPGDKPRFGSPCERTFGVSNTQFVHNLRGNTPTVRNVRQVTPPMKVNKASLSRW
jgi:hypothetical protein